MNKEQQEEISGLIQNFATKYKTEMRDIASKMSNIFEAYCYILLVQYYEYMGLNARPKNLTRDGVFKFRFSTSGHPWNFSYFLVYQDEYSNEALFEIRHNQQVAGYFMSQKSSVDGKLGLFALDVAVILPNSLPDLPMGTKRKPELNVYVQNEYLITFGEAKKLVAYPMLLASFYGVVHELKPEFVDETISQQASFKDILHPFPILFTSDHLTEGTKNILTSFEERKFRIKVVCSVNSTPISALLDYIRGVSDIENLANQKHDKNIGVI